jgi:hypothetical protein
MGKCRTKLDGSRPSFMSQNSLQILIPETRVSQNVLLDINPNTLLWCSDLLSLCHYLDTALACHLALLIELAAGP